MKFIALGITALLLPFIFAGMTVFAQSPTSNPTPTTTSASTQDVTVPTGAPRTGYGG